MMFFSLAIVTLGISVIASPDLNVGAGLEEECGVPCTTICNPDASNGTFENLIPDCNLILENSIDNADGPLVLNGPADSGFFFTNGTCSAMIFKNEDTEFTFCTLDFGAIVLDIGNQCMVSQGRSGGVCVAEDGLWNITVGAGATVETCPNCVLNPLSFDTLVLR